MRTIKFRGKCAKDSKYAGEWVYGSCVQCEKSDDVLITAAINDRCSCTYHVDPDTVGQFTGLQDANGTDIYEGDLLVSHENGEVFEVVYDAPRFCFKDNVFGFKFLNHPENFEVCGNILDNKDFMERLYNRPKINNVAELLKDTSYYANKYPFTHVTYEDLEKRLMGCEKVVGAIFGVDVAKDVDRCYGFEVIGIIGIDGDVAIVNYIGLMKS